MQEQSQMDWIISAEEMDLRKQQLAQVLTYLRTEFVGYPFNEEKDPRYFKLLFDEFPTLNIEEEVKQYHAWTLDQDEGKKIFYRSRFRSWLKMAKRFTSGRRGFRYA